MKRTTSALLLVLAILVALRASAHANQTFYVGPNGGTWSNANNWDVHAVPVAGDDAVIGSFVPARSTVVNVTFDANYPPPGPSPTPDDFSRALNSLTIDSTGTNGGAVLNQTASGTRMAAKTMETVTSVTPGSTYNQSAGTNTCGGNLYLGEGSGSSGTYNLSGTGNLLLHGFVDVGDGGVGVFNQTGGTASVASVLLGYGQVGGEGTYNLSGGTLTVLGTGVGGAGVGVFNQTGGVHTTIQLADAFGRQFHGL
jgi:hypothetical protein